jgi:signal transduction histidine kinase
MWRALRAQLDEPGPPRPARPSTFDFTLAAIGVALVLLEASTRKELVLPALQIPVALVVSSALAWRRVHPLLAVLVAFGLASALTLVEIALALPELALHASAVVLLLPYALLRYASWREVLLGLGAVLLTYGLAALAGELHGSEEAIGGLVVLLFPAALGATLRFRDLAHRRDVQHAQLSERQMLARELHDTVAHHVAAIVIQSQAARAVASKRPEAVTEALVAIEGEAVRSLAELRSLVGALRDADLSSALAPEAGIEAIEGLVRDAGDHASLERAGDLDDLAPAVGLALHRIARESLHNAKRHARGATRIDVHLVADERSVRLTVLDDGEHWRPAARASGVGIVGMRERASLLGGTLEAGPLPARGWKVEVVLPRTAADDRSAQPAGARA